MTDVDDAQLVNRTLAGDTAAYEGLVRKYRRAAIACAFAILGEEAEAEDVAQDAMIQAYEQLPALRVPAKFGGWLLVAVRRRAKNVLRSPRRRRATSLEPAAHLAAGDTPHDVLETSVARAALLTALRQLPDLHREVLLLADLGGRTHAEIAELLGISVLTSRQSLARGRRKMRMLLGGTDLDPDDQ